MAKALKLTVTLETVTPLFLGGAEPASLLEATILSGCWG